MNEDLELLQKKYDRVIEILQHIFPEKNGQYFISGASTDLDENGLPDSLYVCPAYGADFTVTYKKVKD